MSALPSHAAPLAGHVALVTGAARGIGEATVRRLARLGAAVCVADIDGGPAEVVASELVDAGLRAMAVASTSPSGKAFKRPPRSRRKSSAT